MLYYIIIYYMISYYNLLYHIISYNIISYHIISSYIILYHITSYHIILYYIISYDIILYHIISYCIILYYVILYYIILYVIDVPCKICKTVLRHHLSQQLLRFRLSQVGARHHCEVLRGSLHAASGPLRGDAGDSDSEPGWNGPWGAGKQWMEWG